MTSTRSKSPARNPQSELAATGADNGARVDNRVPIPLATQTASPSDDAASVSMKLETFLIDVADTLNSTLEMDKLLARVAELVR